MKHYVFIDESGDLGKLQENATNSGYYAELALQIDSNSLDSINKHIINWRYIKGIFREVKTIPKGVDGTRFIEPLSAMMESGLIRCSTIYVDKSRYTGPYLNEGKPLKFRNYIHRQLLEYHFSQYPADNAVIELIFDRFELSKEEETNLELYLTKNWNLPKLKYITHLDSLYCEILQLTSQLVNLVKDNENANMDTSIKNVLGWLKIKHLS